MCSHLIIWGAIWTRSQFWREIQLLQLSSRMWSASQTSHWRVHLTSLPLPMLYSPSHSAPRQSCRSKVSYPFKCPLGISSRSSASHSSTHLSPWSASSLRAFLNLMPVKGLKFWAPILMHRVAHLRWSTEVLAWSLTQRSSSLGSLISRTLSIWNQSPDSVSLRRTRKATWWISLRLIWLCQQRWRSRVNLSQRRSWCSVIQMDKILDEFSSTIRCLSLSAVTFLLSNSATSSLYFQKS